MSRQVRLGFVGAEHPHFHGVMASALACPTAEVVGMSIEDPELRDYLAERFSSVPAFASAEALYAEGAPEAIVTCADNRRAAAVVVDAAERGVHAMKEKPMAADLSLARSMAEAASANGVRLMINWSTCWRASVRLAKDLLDAGAIGCLVGLHHRAGHDGPPSDYASRDPSERVGWGWLIDEKANGGGAAVDFCCYGAAMACWLIGVPRSVVGLGGRYVKDFFSVEDNAAFLLGYPGAHAVVEGTWTQVGSPYRLPTMLYGESGTIAVVGADEVHIARRREPGGQVTIESLTAPPLPIELASGPDHFTRCLIEGRPFEGLASVEVSLAAQEVLEAGLASMRSGRLETLPLGDGEKVSVPRAGA